jgi:uncharacterized membrane protein YqjE
METGRSGEARQEAKPGFVDGIAMAARDFASLAFNRMELAALELGEVRSALLRLLLVGALAIVAIWFAVAYWTALIVYLSWNALGWKILPIVAVVFSLIGYALLRHVHGMVEEGRLSMSATMAELRADRDMLLRQANEK